MKKLLSAFCIILLGCTNTHDKVGTTNRDPMSRNTPKLWWQTREFAEVDSSAVTSKTETTKTPQKENPAPEPMTPAPQSPQLSDEVY